MAEQRWFLVLPDSVPALAVAQRVQPFACRTIAHASGRPFLMGCWAADEIVIGASGTDRVAALGICAASAAELLAWVERGVEPRSPGAFHLIGSAAGHLCVRGTAFGTHRVFHAVVDGVRVAADRARTLAWLLDAPVDDERLALRMAYPTPPHPLDDTAMWQGVEALAAGVDLTVDPAGATRVRRWWEPPEPVLPVAEGARVLRAALVDAVAARAGAVLAADLSGGLDSTSLCFLAAGADLVTVTLRWAAAGNEDAVWADRAAAHLPGGERLVYEPDELPAFFTGIGTPRGAAADEPTIGMRDDAQQEAIDQDLLARGVRLRLCGHGGDHVVRSPPSYLHDLFRRAPATAVRHAMGYRARHRWTVADAARMLTDPTSHRRWSAAAGERLSAAPATAPHPWGTPPRLPPWASDRTLQAAADVLRRCAAEPLSPFPGRHARLQLARTAGRVARQIAMRGLPTASPFCDDRVIEAGLAVRAEETASPWTYKPLLALAMRDLVPAELLTRTSKDHSGHEWYTGLRQQRPALAALADSSALVRRGMADPDLLRRALLSPQLSTLPVLALEQTLGCEMWLREIEAHPTPSYLRKEHHAVAR